MEAILDTDDPAYVLVTLGKNPDNYQNMLDLTPGRLRNELFKIAQERAAKAAPAPKPKPSNAPTRARSFRQSLLRKPMTRHRSYRFLSSSRPT